MAPMDVCSEPGLQRGETAKRKQNQNHLIKSCHTEKKKVAKPQNISFIMLLLRARSDMRAAVKVNSLRPAGVWPSGRESTHKNKNKKKK